MKTEVSANEKNKICWVVIVELFLAGEVRERDAFE